METGNRPKTMEIAPSLPNSPVVDHVKRFIERVYWYVDRLPTNDDTAALKTVLDVQRKDILHSMGEILADDSVILVSNRLPSDRVRKIGTKRGIWS